MVAHAGQHTHETPFPMTTSIDVFLSVISFDPSDLDQDPESNIKQRLIEVLPRLSKHGVIVIRVLPRMQSYRIAYLLSKTNFGSEADPIHLSNLGSVMWFKTHPNHPPSHDRTNPHHWATILAPRPDDNDGAKYLEKDIYCIDDDNEEEDDDSKSPQVTHVLTDGYVVCEEILVFARSIQDLHTNAVPVGQNKRGQQVYRTPTAEIFSPALENEPGLPRDLCQQLLRFYCPKDGQVADPFASMIHTADVALACAEMNQDPFYEGYQLTFVDL